MAEGEIYKRYLRGAPNEPLLKDLPICLKVGPASGWLWSSILLLWSPVEHLIQKFRRNEPRTFDAEVLDGALVVSQQLYEVLGQYFIHTASAYVAYARGFPEALSKDLGWTIPEVEHALNELLLKLRGHVDPELLIPCEPLEAGYGVLLNPDPDISSGPS